ncbi:hypothetical protein BD414DRAFT_159970 [Trametes punicea]|nr:hypothetical protein BD414DRAFT_159970 [Trametes punicea]
MQSTQSVVVFSLWRPRLSTLPVACPTIQRSLLAVGADAHGRGVSHIPSAGLVPAIADCLARSVRGHTLYLRTAACAKTQRVSLLALYMKPITQWTCNRRDIISLLDITCQDQRRLPTSVFLSCRVATAPALARAVLQNSTEGRTLSCRSSPCVLLTIHENQVRVVSTYSSSICSMRGEPSPLDSH